MKAVTRRKLEMAARVQLFVLEHPSADAGFAARAKQLEEALVRAEQLKTAEREATLEERSAVEARNATRDLITGDLLRPLTKAGNALGRTASALAGRYPAPPASASNVVFLTAAKDMLANATTHAEQLLAVGLPPLLLEELRKRIAEFEVQTTRAADARRRHITANQLLEAAAAEIGEVIQLLNAHYRFTFGRNQAMLNAWNRTRKIAAAPQYETQEPAPQLEARALLPRPKA